MTMEISRHRRVKMMGAPLEKPNSSTNGFPSHQEYGDPGEQELAALEPAWGKAATFFRTGHRFGHPRGSLRCMSLLEVHRMLNVYRARFEKGDTLSLLQAIRYSAEENLPLPQWLAEAFSSRLNLFMQPGRYSSLDQVFTSTSLPTASPKRAAAARLDWQLAGQLWGDAWNLALGDESFVSLDAVIERLLSTGQYGVGKTKAKALIAMIGKSQSEYLMKEATLSRFLLNRRKRMT